MAKYNNAPFAKKVPTSFSDFLKWQFTGKKEKWPNWVEVKVLDKLPPMTDDFQILFINHASFLIRHKDVTILTDPIWSERTSPVQWAGPKRVHAPAIKYEALEKVDVVIISHNHYDHLDEKTLQNLDRDHSPTFVVPRGDKDLLLDFGIKSKVIEMDWWVNAKIDQLKLSMTPAVHFSGRGLFDRNESFWGGYYFTISNTSFFFAGDTGYSHHFKEIKKRYGAPDISLIPIGAYEPRWFMKYVHINPKEAVRAHIDLQSKFSIGMHFGTFQLTDEAIDTPVKDLIKSLQENNLSHKDFVAPKVGEVFNFPSKE
jgi:L-ascorbate metabolism protein UlaG (beta-lactamase superfamily)